MKTMIILFEILISLLFGFILMYSSNFNKALVLSAIIYWIINIYLGTK